MRCWGHIAVLLTLSCAGFASAADTQAQDKAHSLADAQDLAQAHRIHRQAYRHNIAENYDEALKLYDQSAAMGLAKSENAIGRILAFDRNKRNYVKGLPWFIRAAAPRDINQGQGFAQAQKQAKDYLDWYCRSGAAEFPETHPFANNPKCLEGRGKALLSGKRRVKKDYAQAQLYLERAVAAGRDTARAPLAQAIELNVPPTPRNYGKIAGGIAALLLFSVLMRIFRWRQRLYWLVHHFSI